MGSIDLAALIRGEREAWLSATPSLLPAIEEEGVSALLCQVGREREWWGKTSPRLRATLEEVASREAALELIRHQELAGICRELTRQGIDFLLMKGTPLAYTHYEVPSARSRCDNDVLIRAGDLPELSQLLERHGYEVAKASGDELLFGQLIYSKRDLFGCEHVLDVHWEVSARKLFARAFDFEELLATSRAVDPIPESRALGNVEACLLACVHPAMHHHNEQRVLWLYDVHLLAARFEGPDFSRLLALAKEKELLRIVLAAVRNAHERFATPLPTGYLETLEKEAESSAELSAEFLREGRGWKHDVLSDLRHLGWRDRFRLLREICFPRPDYVMASYGLNSSLLKGLLPLLYLHRGFRGIGRKFLARRR